MNSRTDAAAAKNDGRRRYHIGEPQPDQRMALTDIFASLASRHVTTTRETMIPLPLQETTRRSLAEIIDEALQICDEELDGLGEDNSFMGTRSRSSSGDSPSQ